MIETYKVLSGTYDTSVSPEIHNIQRSLIISVIHYKLPIIDVTTTIGMRITNVS